jgi:adenylate kinase family enzyme
MQQANDYPTLVLVRGLPGSGKSYIATRLQQAIEEAYSEKVVMLDPDATDYDSAAYAAHVKAQTAEGVDPKLHAYRFLRAQAYDGIAARKIVIWNQPFTNLEIFNKMVDRLRTHATEHNTRLPILVVEVEIDHDTAKARIATRKAAGGHGPSDNTFTRFTNDYTSFGPHGYTTVAVNGEDDALESVETIMESLQSLWSSQKD